MNAKTCLVVIAVGASLGSVWLWRENGKLRKESAGMEELRSELARTVESARIQESEALSLKEKLAQVQNELADARSAVTSTVPATVPNPPTLAEEAKGQPVGLTTNDIILASMQVAGSSNIGVLFVPLTGWALESVREFRIRRNPLVFGRLINRWEDYGVWGDYGTNIGVALKFKSRGAAEAAAAQLREGVE